MGCSGQWDEFRTAWSSGSDDEIGSVEDLTGHLKEIIAEEQERRRAGELPEEAPAPIMKRKTFKELGTLTPQAEQLGERHTKITAEQLRAAAVQEQERLEERGEIDRVADGQPKEAPSFDSLVDKEIEVRWRYWVKDPSRKSGRRSQYIWCAAPLWRLLTGPRSGHRNANRRCLGVQCALGGR